MFPSYGAELKCQGEILHGRAGRVTSSGLGLEVNQCLEPPKIAVVNRATADLRSGLAQGFLCRASVLRTQTQIQRGLQAVVRLCSLARRKVGQPEMKLKRCHLRILRNRRLERRNG